MRNFNVFNRLQHSENELFKKVQKGLSKKGHSPEREPSSMDINSGEKPKIAEDEYTIKQELENAYSTDKNLFIDKDGRQIPIDRLSPLDPFDADEPDLTAEMAARDEAQLEKQAAEDENLREAGPDADESYSQEKLSNEKKKEYFKNWHPDLKSIEKFYSRHHERKDDRHGLGLYKDYNPKLNAGAPGNREENRRKTREVMEKEKWASFKGSDLPEKPNIVDIISENQLGDTDQEYLEKKAG